MFKILFNIIINLMATIIQIVTLPLNLVITNTLPNFSNKISQVVSGVPTLFSGIYWATGLLPPGVLEVLLFIITIEIAKHTIFANTHALLKVWNILQKIKFW